MSYLFTKLYADLYFNIIGSSTLKHTTYSCLAVHPNHMTFFLFYKTIASAQWCYLQVFEIK